MMEKKRFRLKVSVKDGKLINRKIEYNKKHYDGNEESFNWEFD